MSQSFVVFSVYYKHGEFSVTEVNGESELRSVIWENLKRFGRMDVKELSVLDDMDLEDLISFAIDQGKRIISSQYGYGIVSVVCGTYQICYQ
jgi:hypothetical protein